jgi:Protein of unknown function (DUF3467)
MSDARGEFEPAGALKGQYANYCRVGQNSMEFVMDFGQRYSEEENPIFHTRIVTTPIHMRAILAALEEAVAQYENRFPQPGKDV